jgi:hypothetical protein
MYHCRHSITLEIEKRMHLNNISFRLHNSWIARNAVV